jgi:hypothetical protein
MRVSAIPLACLRGELVLILDADKRGLLGDDRVAALGVGRLEGTVLGGGLSGEETHDARQFVLGCVA